MKGKRDRRHSQVGQRDRRRKEKLDRSKSKSDSSRESPPIPMLGEEPALMPLVALYDMRSSTLGLFFASPGPTGWRLLRGCLVRHSLDDELKSTLLNRRTCPKTSLGEIVAKRVSCKTLA